VYYYYWKFVLSGKGTEANIPFMITYEWVFYIAILLYHKDSTVVEVFLSLLCGRENKSSESLSYEPKVELRFKFRLAESWILIDRLIW
jgi:hypothetical protein